MKKLLLLFTLAPCLAFGQTTLIPDANFEQALIDLGYDTGTPDGSVPTANISGVDSLVFVQQSISDLTGIEDFVALTLLGCAYNQLTSLDVSNNTALTDLYCSYNQLTSLDVSGCTALTYLNCSNNQLTALDVSNNTALTDLWCYDNQLTSLDVSNNTALDTLYCAFNQLTSLNVSGATALGHLYCMGNLLTTLDVSGATALTLLWCFDNLLTSLDASNNTALVSLYCTGNQLTCLNIKNTVLYTTVEPSDFTGNPNLICIEVDDSTWSTAYWTDIDSQTSFSEDCNNPCSSTTGIPEPPTIDKELLTITDVLGRTTQPKPNTLLFYIYEDGSVEKKIQLER